MGAKRPEMACAVIRKDTDAGHVISVIKVAALQLQDAADWCAERSMTAERIRLMKAVARVKQVMGGIEFEIIRTHTKAT